MPRNVSASLVSQVVIIPRKEKDGLPALKAGLKSAFWRMPLVEAIREKRSSAAMRRISPVSEETERFISFGAEEVPAGLGKALAGLSEYEKKVLWKRITLLGDRIFGEWAEAVLGKNPGLVLECYEESGKWDVRRHMYQPENLETTHLLTWEAKAKADRLIAVHQAMWPKKNENLGHEHFEAIVAVGMQVNSLLHTRTW